LPCSFGQASSGTPRLRPGSSQGGRLLLPRPQHLTWLPAASQAPNAAAPRRSTARAAGERVRGAQARVSTAPREVPGQVRRGVAAEPSWRISRLSFFVLGRVRDSGGRDESENLEKIGVDLVLIRC